MLYLLVTYTSIYKTHIKPHLTISICLIIRNLKNNAL